MNKLLNFRKTKKFLKKPLTNTGMWNRIYNKGDYFKISADKNTISQKHPNNYQFYSGNHGGRASATARIIVGGTWGKTGEVREVPRGKLYRQSAVWRLAFGFLGNSIFLCFRKTTAQRP